MSTILIVEDSAVIREPLEATLAAAGYSAIACADGEAALRHLVSNPPDLVLLDINLPKLDGLSLLERVRANQATKNIPVIVLTAIAEKPRVIRALQLGISAYMLKSRFSLSEMLEKVRQHLAEPSTRLNSSGGDMPAEQAKPAAVQASAQAPAPAPGAAVSTPAAAAARPITVVQPELAPGADPIEALKALKPILSRSELTERVENCGELKGLSPAVSQVLKLTGNDRCSIEQVAKAISQDHAIALKVLKLANSAVYTRGEPVDSVQLAVSRIGLGQIRQTVLNLSVVEHFSATPNSPVDPGQFWEHAIACGFIAAELARSQELDADSAFTMGLLHDVGRMIFADEFGEAYCSVLEVASNLKLPAEQVESRMLLFNHADVMDRVLHKWKFPKQLINPIVFHHLSAGNIRGAASRQINEVAVLGLANRLAHAMMLGTSGNETIYQTIDLCELLKLDPQVILDVHDKTREETDKIKFALLARTNAANWMPRRDVHRSALSEPLRPLFVSMTPHYDAFRLFCEEIASPEVETPNIGVININSARDRVAVSNAYRAAEHDAGVEGLPLLVMSPAGKLSPENSLLAGRSVEHLPTPLVIPRFIAAANAVLASRPMASAA